MDLSDPAFDADPYPTYARLREERPVCRLEPRDGLYGRLVTRYEDARTALADPRLSKDPRVAPADWREAGRGRPLEDRSGLGTHLLTTDPPEHTRLRRAVSAVFAPHRIEGLRERVREIADSLVDAMPARGEVELIGEFAFPLPIMVICELLGIDAADRDRFRDWTAAVVGAAGDRPAALRDLRAYLSALVAAKRRAPGDDLVSTLVKAGLGETETVSMVFLLLIAGHETTVNLIGNGVLALLRHPDQLALLRRRPGLLDTAVEEILRYDGPVETATWRFATEPVRIGETLIAAGEPVLVVLAAADRDPARFAAPDRLDITRTDNPHLAFGRGIHYCLGAHLARLEGRIALGTLLRRLPDLALAVPPSRLRWRHSLTVRGPHELPVACDAGQPVRR